MIVVATRDFEVYHGVVAELRDRDATFTTIEPGEALPDRATVAVTGPADPAPVDADRVVVADPDDPRAAVEDAVRGHRDRGRRVVGVDPGDRPGVAVLEAGEVVAAFQVPLADAVDVVRRELNGVPDPVVRIGDGARLAGARLIDGLGDVRVELVDETGTTPHVGPGARGAGDVLAAANIAAREGEPLEARAVDPTPGELQGIKTASREASPENREITERLARRVAAGDLTIEEALDAHRDGRDG